jgi:hypothetical protein
MSSSIIIVITDVIRIATAVVALWLILSHVMSMSGSITITDVIRVASAVVALWLIWSSMEEAPQEEGERNQSVSRNNHDHFSSRAEVEACRMWLIRRNKEKGAAVHRSPVLLAQRVGDVE